MTTTHMYCFIIAFQKGGILDPKL